MTVALSEQDAYRSRNLGINGRLMRDAAIRENVAWDVFTPTHIKASNDWLRLYINGRKFIHYRSRILDEGINRWGNIGQSINYRAGLLVADKSQAKQHLTEHGFSVPHGISFRRKDVDQALTTFDSFNSPVCVKPVNGTHGECVHNNISDRQHFELAVQNVAGQFKKVMIEEMVKGQHFRFFYVHPHVAGISIGVPLSVTGDGQQTIQQLLDEKNRHRAERDLPTHPQIKLNDDILFAMSCQGLALEDVIANDQVVCLRNVSNHLSGGETITLPFGDVHHSYIKLVERACQSIKGLYFCGVDMVIQDIAKPATPDNHWFLELNSTPGTPAFYYPWAGDVVDVSGKILNMLKTHYPFND